MNLPGYWMNETSGVLEPVVRRYLEGAELELGELATMRAYLRQWIEAPGFRGPDVERLRTTLTTITSTTDLRRWMSEALDAGIDPL
jgi:hypothetical protein